MFPVQYTENKGDQPGMYLNVWSPAWPWRGFPNIGCWETHRFTDNTNTLDTEDTEETEDIEDRAGARLIKL